MNEIQTFEKVSNVTDQVDGIENIGEEEMDLTEFFQKLWDGKKLIIKVMVTFLTIGAIYALISPEEYEVKVVLLPEISSNKPGGMLSQLGGLAALGGINLDQLGQSEAIRPDLYPNITESLPAMIDIMYKKVYIPSKDTSATVYVYLKELNSPILGNIKKFTVGLPRLVLNALKDEDRLLIVGDMFDDGINKPIFLTYDERKLIQNLRKRIITEIDRKTGIITLAVKMPDPHVAASVAQGSVEYLTEYVTSYRISKARLNLEFIGDRHKDAEEKFKASQKKLALFRDQNRNVVTASARIEEEILLSEYNLLNNLFLNLSQQLEQAKIKVQEETPVMQVLEPVSIPNERSEPKRVLIVIGFVVAGIVIGVLYILYFSEIFDSFRKIKL